MTADVFLTGGSGLVGGHLLRALIASGDTVRALVRSDSADSLVAALGAEPVRVALSDVSGLADAMAGSSIVYHVAGVNEMCPRDVTYMDHVNVGGTRSVVRGASHAGVDRVVYTSSAATIGERKGTVGTESTRHSGAFLSAYARSKFRGERAAFAEGRESGIDVVSVNPSSVQGPGRSGGSARILLYTLGRRRPLLVDTTVSLVDIEDCTAGHIAAASRGVNGERYLLSGSSLRVKELVAMAAAVADRTIQPLWVSGGVVLRIGRPSAKVASVLFPGSDVCPELVATLLHGHRFDATKAVRHLRVEYTPIESTLSRTVRWFGAEGLID